MDSSTAATIKAPEMLPKAALEAQTPRIVARSAAENQEDMIATVSGQPADWTRPAAAHTMANRDAPWTSMRPSRPKAMQVTAVSQLETKSAIRLSILSPMGPEMKSPTA